MIFGVFMYLLLFFIAWSRYLKAFGGPEAAQEPLRGELCGRGLVFIDLKQIESGLRPSARRPWEYSPAVPYTVLCFLWRRVFVWVRARGARFRSGGFGPDLSLLVFGQKLFQNRIKVAVLIALGPFFWVSVASLAELGPFLELGLLL